MIEFDYDCRIVEKPPTILFRHQLGPIAQSNDGRLIVYPGTIVHMECLWIRRFGTPKWEVSHQYRYALALSAYFQWLRKKMPTIQNRGHQKTVTSGWWHLGIFRHAKDVESESSSWMSRRPLRSTTGIGARVRHGIGCDTMWKCRSQFFGWNGWTVSIVFRYSRVY